LSRALKAESALSYAQVYVTGHSLGGALANLAAYDIAKALKGCKNLTKVVCYTFGAPRTGNHSFARDYNKVVPDTWSIINDQVTPSSCAGLMLWQQESKDALQLHLSCSRSSFTIAHPQGRALQGSGDLWKACTKKSEEDSKAMDKASLPKPLQ
jgi:hypothetical protein